MNARAYQKVEILETTSETWEENGAEELAHKTLSEMNLDDSTGLGNIKMQVIFIYMLVQA